MFFTNHLLKHNTRIHIVASHPSVELLIRYIEVGPRSVMSTNMKEERKYGDIVESEQYSGTKSTISSPRL